MHRQARRFAVLITAVVFLGGITAAAGAVDTGTIKGNVKYDGVGLAHVSVFLRDPGTGPRVTCTNANGFYKFTDVTAGDGIIMATGPGECVNRYFLNPDGDQLLVQWYKRHNGVLNQTDEIKLGSGETLKITFRPRLANGASCGGYKATKTGTGADDILIGTADTDVIVGKGGNDTIEGKGGRDFLCGDKGNDVIDGGVGGDWWIYGGPGKDILRGGRHSDLIDGGTGSKDVLKGGKGFDTCFDPDGWMTAKCENGP